MGKFIPLLIWWFILQPSFDTKHVSEHTLVSNTLRLAETDRLPFFKTSNYTLCYILMLGVSYWPFKRIMENNKMVLKSEKVINVLVIYT